MKIKKYLLIGLSLLSSTTLLSGCGMELKSSKDSQEVKQAEGYILNETRNEDKQNYVYDWIDFVDIEVYGTDGSAFLEIHPKELKSTDFNSDEDYVAVTEAIEEMDLNYVGGSNNKSSYLTVDKGFDLTSGYVVTLGLTGGFSGLSVYRGDYEYRIDNLKETLSIDLFNSENVTFYGLEGTSEINWIYPSGSVLSEIDGYTDNVDYTITKDSSSVEVDKTKLTVKASLDSDYISENDLSSFSLYLARNGYKTESYEATVVLHNMATTVDFEDDQQAKVTINELTSKVSELELKENADSEFDGYELSSICSIHKLSRSSSDSYSYYVVYRDTNSLGDVQYFRRQIRFCTLNGQTIILQTGNREKTTENYVNNAYMDGELVYVNVVTESSEENIDGENTEENVDEVQDENVENTEETTPEE